MNTILTNAFSINMLVQSDEIVFHKVTAEDVAEILFNEEWQSAVGHENTAAVLSTMLGVDIPTSRTNVTLERGATLIVAQYTGPRLPEGATTLPEGASIQFWQVFQAPHRPWNFPEGAFKGERIAEIQGI